MGDMEMLAEMILETESFLESIGAEYDESTKVKSYEAALKARKINHSLSDHNITE